MVDYEKEFAAPAYKLDRRIAVARTFRLVYGWMFAGLALSGAVAWYVASTPAVFLKVFSGPGLAVCCLAELGLVMGLSAAIRKISPAVALLMFLSFAAVNGLTLSGIFLAYELQSVQTVFFVTAGMFGGLALYGTFTKSDLSGVGAFCGMALWGLVLALVVNMFLGSSRLDTIVSFVGILTFTGLTMYDAQEVRKIADGASAADDASLRKAGIIGALALYLDFVNMLIYLLRFFGRRR